MTVIFCISTHDRSLEQLKAQKLLVLSKTMWERQKIIHQFMQSSLPTHSHFSPHAPHKAPASLPCTHFISFRIALLLLLLSSPFFMTVNGTSPYCFTFNLPHYYSPLEA